jgi:hypothetical protein
MCPNLGPAEEFRNPLEADLLPPGRDDVGYLSNTVAVMCDIREFSIDYARHYSSRIRPILKTSCILPSKYTSFLKIPSI